MGKFLTDKERLALRRAHRSASQQRFADRIKTILLLDADWKSGKIYIILDNAWYYKGDKIQNCVPPVFPN